MNKAIFLSVGLLFLYLAAACNSGQARGNGTSVNESFSEELPTEDPNIESISWEVSANNKYWHKKDDKYAYIAVKVVGNEKKTDKKRVPLNISLVLDRSGSMTGDAVKYAKDAAKFVVKQLSSEDILSVVNYDDRIEVTSPSEAVRNKEILTRKIDEIYARGMTNLSGGTLEGYKQVASTKKTNYVSRVLLLTDGLANEGITDSEKLNKIPSTKFTEEGIALSTFGLGAEYNEDLLTQMAESGRGNYYYIDAADKIPAIFAKELDGLLNVVAQNATVSIDLPAGVKFEKIYGYTHTEKGGKILVALNDIFAKEEKVFLLKVELTDRNKNELSFPIEITYTDADNFASNTKKGNLNILGTNDIELIAGHKNASTTELIALFEATDAFDVVLSDVDKSNYEEAKVKAKAAINQLQEAQKETPSADLKMQEEKMQEYMNGIDNMKEMEREEKMILQKSNKSVNYSVKKRK